MLPGDLITFFMKAGGITPFSDDVINLTYLVAPY